MSIEEKDKEKDKSIYNYNMIFNKIGNNNSEEDIKFNTDLISDLDLRNFDPRRYEYYTNLLKIYNEDPDTLFNLLNKYNSIKYTKEDEKKLIRQIYDYAVKYADDVFKNKGKLPTDKVVAEKANAVKVATTITEEQGGGGGPGGARAGDGAREGDGAGAREGSAPDAATDAAADAAADAADAKAKAAAAASGRGKVKKVVETIIIPGTKVLKSINSSVEDSKIIAKLTPIEKLINELSNKLNNENVPNPGEDEDIRATYSDNFVNNYDNYDENEKKTPEEKLKDNDEKNLNEMKNTYKDTIKTPEVKKATATPIRDQSGVPTRVPPRGQPGDQSGVPTGVPIGVPTGDLTRTRVPTGQEQELEEDKLLMGAIELDLIGDQPVLDQPPVPTPPPVPIPSPAAAENKILDNAFNLLPGLLKNIDEDKLLHEALQLSQKILNNIKGIENGKKTILDEAVDLLPKLLHKEPVEAAAAAVAQAEESTLLNKTTNLLSGLLKKDPADPAAEDKEILDNTLNLSKKLLNSAQEGGKTKLRGGAIDKYSDDILKMQYLNTKRYNNVKKEDLRDYRKQQKIRKYNIVPTETSNKIEQLSNDMDVYNDKIDKDNDDDKYIIQRIKNFENDPKNPIEELALTFDDRIVFIIATFFIRYITIIMVQWCIDINIIKTFYEGFIYYAIIYILIFWFIVLFVNIDNTYDVKYMNFNGVINSIRTIFYYFYMGTNGISRLLIHTSLIIILIIIPIILNIKGKVEFKDEDQSDAVVILAYEERKQLSKSLSLFTMFIWLFTSIIATKF
jgi:hypothetical protein